MSELVRTPFRLAIRKEGNFINAYIAPAETMEGAMLVGSIALAWIEGGDDFFDRWKELMVTMFAVVIEDALGVAPIDMEEESAPEHERAGHS